MRSISRQHHRELCLGVECKGLFTETLSPCRLLMPIMSTKRGRPPFSHKAPWAPQASCLGCFLAISSISWFLSGYCEDEQCSILFPWEMLSVWCPFNHSGSGDSTFVSLAERNHLLSYHEWIILMLPLCLTNKRADCLWSSTPHSWGTVFFLFIFSLIIVLVYALCTKLWVS